jgi:HEAT repeat protein
MNASLADRRLAAAKALQSMGPISDSLLDQLILLLHDDAAAVRVQTLLTIGNLNGNRKRTVSSIERLLSDNNIFVRQAAIMTLGRIGQDAKSVLPQLKSRSDERGRMDGAWYARLVGVSHLPSWFDQKPDFPDRTMDEAVTEAIAAIDRDAN